MKTSLSVGITVEIDRPTAEVWAVVSDFTRLPEWLDEFERVVQESGGPVGKGTVFRYTLTGDRSALVEIVAWEPGRRVAWDGPPLPSRIGGARPRGSFEVTDLAAGRTRFVSRWEPELSGLLAVLRPALTRWLKKQRTADTQHLKQMLEERQAGRGRMNGPDVVIVVS